MTQQAFLYILIASSFTGIISQLRKKYQMRTGTGLVSTLLFTLLVSIAAAIGGSFLSDGLQLETYSFLFAFCYALLSTVTTSICIYGTAFGNAAILIMYATLGTLTIPSVFGLIAQPEENILTLAKGLGFLFALFCLLLNFVGNAREKSSTKFKLLCLLVFFTNGWGLVVFNLKNRLCGWYSHYSFLTECMILSALLAAAVLAILLARNKTQVTTETKQTFNKGNLAIILGYAVLYFAIEILSLNCAEILPLIIQAPVSFCVPVIVTALLDYVLYREKLSKVNVLQIIAAVLCCLCFVMDK